MSQSTLAALEPNLTPRPIDAGARIGHAHPKVADPDPPLPPRPIDAGVRIGHAHLKVADLDRALAFYCGVLGFELKQRYGRDAAFLAAGGYHHHIGLNTWESKGGPPPPPGTTGLYHVAILYPDRRTLAEAGKAVSEAAP